MLINAWDRTLADWLKRGEQATKEYDGVRRNEIDMENGLYRYRVLSVFGSKYALTDDEVVQPADDMGAQVTPWTQAVLTPQSTGSRSCMSKLMPAWAQ